MSLYMDQTLFNSLVYTISWAEFLGSQEKMPVEETVSKMIQQYQRSFPKDDFVEELVIAKDKFLNWMDSNNYSATEYLAWLDLYKSVSMTWSPNGTKRGRPIFRGIWFTSPRTKPHDRVGTFIQSTALYFAHLHSGKIVV